MIAPIFKQLSAEHASISFNKLDVDDLSEAAEENNISSVPTFQFWNGQTKVAEVMLCYFVHICIDLFYFWGSILLLFVIANFLLLCSFLVPTWNS